MVLLWQKQWLSKKFNHFWFRNQFYLCSKNLNQWSSLSFTFKQVVQYLLNWSGSSCLQWSTFVWRRLLDDRWQVDPNLSFRLYFELFRYLHSCFCFIQLNLLACWTPSFDWVLYCSWQYRSKECQDGICSSWYLE